MSSIKTYQINIRDFTKMSSSEKKIIIELNEHDAWQLMSLIRKELDESDRVWHGYWKRLAQQVTRSIERTNADSARTTLDPEDPTNDI